MRMSPTPVLPAVPVGDPVPGVERVVLSLNAGSSSLKFGLYRVVGASVEELMSGEAQSVGEAQSRFEIRYAGDEPQAQASAHPELLHRPGLAATLAHIREGMAHRRLPAPQAIGHRIVHGGPRLNRHCLIDDVVRHQLESATAFAPVHMPLALALIDCARDQFRGLPQIACLDTSFHANLPRVASVLPLPRALRIEGLRRYGFHGLSCESILHRLGADCPARAVIAHLGSGASITAVRDGMSIDTSMGLTPTGGVIMGTRSGDLDPGILIYLLRNKGYDANALEQLVDLGSGLLAISGLDADMRRLHRAGPGDIDAQLAIAIFCRTVRKQIAAMTAVLEGLDLLVFTGGIGENDAVVRAAICRGMSWVGLELDESRNAAAAVGWSAQPAEIGAAGRPVRVIVAASREDEQIARCSERLLAQRESARPAARATA